MQYTQYLIEAIKRSVMAGEAVLDVYESDFAVETKEDRSPLTLADRRSHETIEAGLIHFGIPAVSEEGKNTPYAVREQWETVWIIDPLDGTKEFVKRNGEFTVNIALIKDNQPVMGVVYAPIPKWLYFASTEIGAYKLSGIAPDTFGFDDSLTPEKQLAALMQNGSKLPISSPRQTYTVVGSRSHGSEELEAYVERIKQEKGNVAFIVAGSSLKICLVAEGSADIYPRLGPTMEWDTAAGQAVASCSGAKMYDFNNKRSLTYNKPDLLNPWFVVER